MLERKFERAKGGLSLGPKGHGLRPCFDDLDGYSNEAACLGLMRGCFGWGNTRRTVSATDAEAICARGARWSGKGRLCFMNS